METLEYKSVGLDPIWARALPWIFTETRISVKQWWSNPRPESICFNLFVSLHSLWGIEQVCELLVNPRIREKEFFNCFLIHKNKHISLIVWFTVKHCSWLPQRCSLLCLELPSLFFLLLLFNSTKHVFWQWWSWSLPATHPSSPLSCSFLPSSPSHTSSTSQN